MHLRKLFLSLFLLNGFSLAALAHEAPVVDVQQNAVSTQPEETTGGGWQTVSNGNEPQSADAQKPAPQQQWVSASSAQPAEQPAEKPAMLASNNPAESSYAPAPSGSLNHRVSRLEQQMTNYTQMNLPQQVSDMQQKVSQMQGQIEVDQREIKALTAQQKTYYQDLEQQVTQLQNSKTAAVTKSTTSDSTAAAASDTTDTTDTTDDESVNTAPAKIVKEKTLTDNTKKAAPSLGDTDSYDKAFRALSKKHFNQAKESFASYLKQYPEGRFAVNAHFWLGEIALMNQHYDDASNQFETVVKKYPHSNKVSDAKLKIAMIHAAKGQTDLAKKEFTQIRKDYPGTTAAQLASIRLQQISGGMTS